MDISKFKLNFPLPRTHCGLVMGNGNFGAMIWGNEALHITVNRADFWDHRGGELIVSGTTYDGLVEVAQTQGTGEELEKVIPRYSFPEEVFKPQRLPVGRFEFNFLPDINPVSVELDYATGRVTVVLSDNSSLLLEQSLNEPLLFVTDEAKAIQVIKGKPAWDFPNAREWLLRCGFQEPERFDWGWVQGCPDDPSLACVCHSSDTSHTICLELGADTQVAVHNACNKIAKIDQNEQIEYNEKWWQEYWSDAPTITFPDAWYNRFFKYALYRFACATHPNGYACSLQGPWQEEYKRAEWSGDYHFNVNIQEIYALAFSTGKCDHLLPLFDMLESESYQKALRHNANVMFGIDDGLWFTHALDDRGQQCGWLIPGSILDPACGAWTSQLYWNYFRYTGDQQFLRERAYPFMRGVMRGYEAMLREEDGQFTIPLAISAEYGCGNRKAGEAGANPSYQLAAAHMLASYLIEACRILGENVKPIWQDILLRLPQFALVESMDNKGLVEKRIGIWEGQDLDVCHRHHSHLASIYPFETMSNPTAEQQEIIENSIDHWVLMGMGQWSEWGIPWAAIINTRMGFTQAPIVLLNIWREVFVNEGLATVYLPRSRGVIAHRRHDLKKPKESNEFIQLDGTMGAATAFLEMLAHQRDHVVHLFQGIPQEWLDVSFSNIHLTGGFSISGNRSNISVTSRFGGQLKIKLAEKVVAFSFAEGETRVLNLE